jgi:hypothetical protein
MQTATRRTGAKGSTNKAPHRIGEGAVGPVTVLPRFGVAPTWASGPRQRKSLPSDGSGSKNVTDASISSLTISINFSPIRKSCSRLYCQGDIVRLRQLGMVYMGPAELSAGWGGMFAPTWTTTV